MVCKIFVRVSREHFKISEDGTIEDMGSANGTFLDRERFLVKVTHLNPMVLSIVTN